MTGIGILTWGVRITGLDAGRLAQTRLDRTFVMVAGLGPLTQGLV